MTFNSQNKGKATGLNTARSGNNSNPAGHSQLYQVIKMDALWKPLIRKFRKFLKMRIMHTLRYEIDESKSVCELGTQFGRILGVSDELLS